LAKRALVTYTCSPCKAKTGKDIEGERLIVGNRVFDVCTKDRKVIDAYMKFDHDFGISVQQAERDARKVAELEAGVLVVERRAVSNGSAGQARKSSGPQTRRYECGLCRENGETRVVAHNSRSWHAGHHHGGLKASEIEWFEV
jgi:hypothetical protein